MTAAPVHATRRAVLAGAAATLTAAPLRAGATPAPATAEPVATVPAMLSAAGRTGHVVITEFRLTHLGVTWSGLRTGGQVRFRAPSGWTQWRRIEGELGSGSSRVAVLTAPAGSTAYEIEPHPDALTRVHELNATDGPRRRVRAAATASGLDALTGIPVRGGYRSRAAWGADESLRFGRDGAETFPQAFYEVQTLTVHHTVTANGDPDPAATMRAIYFVHTVTQNFGDIGYHLLIDERGVVYEGRVSGDDPLPVFGGQAGTRRMSNGAHTGGFNAGNVGVALLADLTGTLPTGLALDALVRVLATLCRITGLDPLGTTQYVNPISGATATVPTIAGHRQWLATECPGNAFFHALPAVRTRVARALSAH